MIDRFSILMTALTAVLLATALAPLFVVEIPAMVDYVDHLARMGLLAGPPSRAYAVQWRLYPNLAMDLIVPELAHVTSVEVAAKIFLGVSQVLVVTGAIFIDLAMKGHHRLGGMGAMLVLFSLPFGWGQVNFMFGMGLAAWGVGLWIWLRARPALIRWVVHALLVAALFVSHFLALGIYGLTIGLYELSRFRAVPALSSLLRLAAFMASPVLIALAIMRLSGGQIGEPIFNWNPWLKLAWLPVFMNVYDLWLSFLSGLVLFCLVLVSAILRWVSLDRAGVWIAAGFVLAYLLMPQGMFASYEVDIRLLTAAGIILPAFIKTRLPIWPARIVPLVLVAGIIATNDVRVAAAWIDYQRDFKELKNSFARLKAGSAVLVGMTPKALWGYRPLMNAPALAAPAADVFVSCLFSYPGMQPIQPRSAFQHLTAKAATDYAPQTLPQLVAIARNQPDSSAPPPLVGWPQKYQYLYLVGDPGPNPLPGRLRQVYAGRRFSLYRIESASVQY